MRQAERVRLITTVLVVVFAAACGSKPSPQPPEPEPGSGSGSTAACVVGGCSSTVCAEETADPIITTCEWRDSYACYRDTTCERQADGACGWTQTEALTTCLASPPAS